MRSEPPPSVRAKPAPTAGSGTGAVADLDGDFVPDLLRITRTGSVWFRRGQRSGHAGTALLLALPGVPALVGLAGRGAVEVVWPEAGGRTASCRAAALAPRRLVVSRP